MDSTTKGLIGVLRLFYDHPIEAFFLYLLNFSLFLVPLVLSQKIKDIDVLILFFGFLGFIFSLSGGILLISGKVYLRENISGQVLTNELNAADLTSGLLLKGRRFETRIAEKQLELVHLKWDKNVENRTEKLEKAYNEISFLNAEREKLYEVYRKNEGDTYEWNHFAYNGLLDPITSRFVKRLAGNNPIFSLLFACSIFLFEMGVVFSILIDVVWLISFLKK